MKLKIGIQVAIVVMLGMEMTASAETFTYYRGSLRATFDTIGSQSLPSCFPTLVGESFTVSVLIEVPAGADRNTVCRIASVSAERDSDGNSSTWGIPKGFGWSAGAWGYVELGPYGCPRVSVIVAGGIDGALIRIRTNLREVCNCEVPCLSPAAVDCTDCTGCEDYGGAPGSGAVGDSTICYGQWDIRLATSEPDSDIDGVPDVVDNCPTAYNPGQADCNNNGIGDVCEIAAGAPDFNGDTIPDTCQCLADLFVDRQVNGADLGALLSQWGPANANTASDMNRDGVVNGADLGYLLSAWGPCPN
jgi:hypothetical protein